ncbi:PhlD [Streptomyces rubiginosohelvolus]|uniref:PhlD n=1 Tax=Streptomyces rubiginosohelvolus TaxID=67362 RepID=UPI00339F3418
MSIVIGRPVVQTAPHWVTTPELVEDMKRRFRPEDLDDKWLRMLRQTGIEKRPWLAPLEETASLEGAGPRSRAAYSGALEMAVGAASEALETAGLDPRRVDCIVTTHTASWTVPGMDVDLVDRLGLRPDVSRIGLATVACAGGGHALIQAVRFVRAEPGARVLVVAAEPLSTLYSPLAGPPTMQSVLYAGLFGDAAAAAVVSEEPTGDGPGLRVENTWEFVLPHSADAYWGVYEETGIAFESGPAAPTAADRILPYVKEWLGERPVDWAAVHPGGPRIISGTLNGLGLDPEAAGHHARASLSHGNLGGVALLDVLSRSLAADAPPRGPGAAVAFGPGFTGSGLYLQAG